MDQSYHLDELRIALNPEHPAHILPPHMRPGSRVLDLGCGAGQTMIAAYPERVTFGLDIDFPALQLGKTLSSGVQFCCGRAEELPYRDDSFDLVLARVSLAYTDIERTLREAHRVMKPEGRLWVTLHSWQTPWQNAVHGNWRGRVFFLYVLCNSLSFHYFQKQFSFWGKRETFQTVSRMQKLMKECGFADVAVTQGRHFLVEAKASKVTARAKMQVAAAAGAH